MNSESQRLGFICPPDHEVFGVVTDRLRDRGFDVEFFEPGVVLERARLDALDLLVNKKVRWESLDALQYAHRAGVPAWNDYVATAIFLNRLSQVGALAAVGFPVPEIGPEKPDDEYVAKGFFDIEEDPQLNGEGDFYQPLLDFDGTDHKYYAVDDGRTVRTAVVQFRSKLYGDRELLGRGSVDPRVERLLRRLLRFTGVRAVGVDVIEVDGQPHAIDANPATSFRRTGLEDALVASIVSAVEA
jgi:glutathione synthase/RimK-type ligase-like ATP-grasp enzyme